MLLLLFFSWCFFVAVAVAFYLKVVLAVEGVVLMVSASFFWTFFISSFHFLAANQCSYFATSW